MDAEYTSELTGYVVHIRQLEQQIKMIHKNHEII